MFRGVTFGGEMASSRLFGRATALSMFDVARDLPRGAAREIGRGQRATGKQLPLFSGGGRHGRLELALPIFGALRVIARPFDVSQRTRESADLAINVLFADSPERVERVFARHRAFDDSADDLEKPITVTLFFLNLAAMRHSGERIRAGLGKRDSKHRAQPS
jgi:hypothetical protein